MNEILRQLDLLYSQNKVQEAYQFLLMQLQQAMDMSRDDLVLGILSELLGYYRVTAQFDLGNQIAKQAINILNAHGLENSIDGATLYLNIATLYRAQGKYQESLALYDLTESIYQKYLSLNDERYASFYNNKSLLYQEMGDYDKALEYELMALSLIHKIPNCEIEEAITYTNLSQIYFSLKQNEEARKSLYHAIAIFKIFNESDPHYFAALSSLAQSYYLEKNYQKAIDLYDQVLQGIDQVFGKNKDYQIVLNNKQKVEKEMHSLKGLDICKMYYETYGKPMLQKLFPEELKYMAIGLCGFGSDCLGYDDEISRDHDFGPGFCIWLPRSLYERIYLPLQQAYDALPHEFMGYKRQTSLHGQGRVGVFCIDDFFLQFIGRVPQSLNDWLYTDENGLLACTNGAVFDDYCGVVTELRNKLCYFPEDVRIKKIARAIAKMAQSGQYNYARCMRRHDKVAASLALHEFIDQTLSVVYLLNHQYKPYYKWSFYGLKDCHVLSEVKDLLEKLVVLEDQSQYYQHQESGLVMDDQKVVIIETICQKVILELNRQRLTDGYDDFLDNHTMNVMSCIKDENMRRKHVMEG